MKRKRRKFTAEEKVGILRRHFLERVPVSDLCDEYGINPTMFYRWQKEFFEQGSKAFEKTNDAKTRKLEEKITRLETKLTHKDEVIAEIMESHVQLKKNLGEI